MDNIFSLKDVPSWGLFGALIGYTFFFRFNQYFLLALQTGKIPYLSRYWVQCIQGCTASGGSCKKATVTNESESAANSNVQSVAPMEMTRGTDTELRV